MARNFSDKTFTKILRGYSPDEVKEYIAYVDGEYRKLERISADNVRKLALALRKLDEMNNYAEQLEKQIEEQGASESGEGRPEINYEELARIKAETLSKAKSDGEAIIADARRQGSAVIADARQQGEAIVTEAEELARSVRDKILTEAAVKAEAIIKEAQERTEATRRSAESMGAAALRMYSEVLSFRDTLFEAYNTHIESIEDIIETADELFGDEDEADEPMADEQEDIAAEEANEGESYEDEGLLAVDISEYGDMLESLEEEAEEMEMDISDFRDIIEEMPMSESADALFDEFAVVSEAEAYDEYADDIETEMIEAAPTDESYADVQEDSADEWISAEDWDMENSEENDNSYRQAAAEYAVDYADVEAEEDEPANEGYAAVLPEDTYESYGEAAVEGDEADAIELEAQKYSNVYLEDDDDDFFTEDATDEELYPDFENAGYAPLPEYAWGDDMFAEPADTAEVQDEADFFDAPANEEDELDRLKQFFSADFDESAARQRSYDVGSNSTTSIALSLNDFFENDEEPADGYAVGDMDSLFEKSPDMSVTDEFDIVFGKMDSAQSVAEIRRQPIIPPEKPGKHKKHKKF